MTRKSLARRLAVLTLPLGAALALMAAPAQAVGGNGTNSLYPRQTLTEGQQLKNGSLTLRMQNDGNLVLYTGSKSCWAAHTNNSSSTSHAYMEPGGDFAVFEYLHSTQLWHTNTNGAGSLALVLDSARKGLVLRYTSGDPGPGVPSSLKSAHC